MNPDYLLCLECESACYVFEWKEGVVREAICEMCGNDDTQNFATEDEYEDLSLDSRYDRTPARSED